MTDGGTPLWAALEDGVVELELALARVGQTVGIVGAAVAAVVVLFVTSGTGLVLLALCVATIVFYTSLHALLTSRPGEPALRWLAPTFEVVVPAATLWILARTEGPEYALGSWVPPQLFTVFIAASILRLDPRIPISMGAAAAAAYGLVWWTTIRGTVDEIALLHRPEVQLTRMVALLLTGAAASLAVVRVRAIVSRTSRSLRERELFGKYRLGEDIASGGMGRVVDAVYCPEGGFQRRVAIKMLHAHLASDPAYVARFRGEAELAARLAHPNIVAALDFGRIRDTYFLAMEFVEGRTLMDVLNERRRVQRPLPPRIVAWLGRQMAEGLDHAHSRATDDAGRILRVVHRDLSPSNILVDRIGRVRITDFGVARALGDAEGIVTRNLVGKPAYVAPETLQEQIVDTRVDLWSLGVVLWEALANERLFARDNEAASMLAVVEAVVPPIAQLREGLSDAWTVFFARILARDRAERFGSAAEIRDALDRILEVEGPVTPDDLRELLATEEGLEELPLDDTSEELAAPVAGAVEAGGPMEPVAVEAVGPPVETVVTTPVETVATPVETVATPAETVVPAVGDPPC